MQCYLRVLERKCLALTFVSKWTDSYTTISTTWWRMKPYIPGGGSVYRNWNLKLFLWNCFSSLTPFSSEKTRSVSISDLVFRFPDHNLHFYTCNCGLILFTNGWEEKHFFKLFSWGNRSENSLPHYRIPSQKKKYSLRVRFCSCLLNTDCNRRL